jgi:peptidoglycan/LPS O-acetylase OafA/YrhL
MGDGRVPSAPGRLVFLDGLRGVAVISVTLLHIFVNSAVRDRTPHWIAAVIGRGYLGVEVFFVLSGFVIAYRVRDALTLGGVGRFMLRRSVRLDPPYWASIALIVVADAASNVLIPVRQLPVPSLTRIVSNMFYVQGLLGITHIDPGYWTLCLEIQLYLCFALLQWLPGALVGAERVRRSWIIRIAPHAVVLAWTAAVLAGWLPDVRGLFVVRWHLFLAGAGACWMIERRLPAPVAVVSAIVMAIAAAVRLDPEMAIAVATAGLIVHAARRGALTRWLGGPVLQYFGRISYTLYLVHVPIGARVMNLGYRLSGAALLPALAWAIVALAAAVAGAHLLWRALERPAVSWSRRVSMAAAGA